MKIILTSLLLIFAFQFCFGQEKPVARQINETGRINCCWGDFQQLLLEIENTKSKGYVIIFGEKENKLKNYLYEQSIRSLYSYRDNPTIVILHGRSESEIRTQFWVVPNGAEIPTFEEEQWDYTLAINKPLKIYDWFDYGEGGGDGVCDMLYQEIYTSRFLLANPELNANLVIYAKTAKKFKSIKSKLIKQFEEDFKITKNRLSFFHILGENPVGNGEIWLVPKRRKS
ncbi:MAG TPA: hypothetical protein PKY82_16970 [Pyrinomonadaceae bacterium]|nr:hypothetical protein [Pyrinomonadaceae bacterium]